MMKFCIALFTLVPFAMAFVLPEEHKCAPHEDYFNGIGYICRATCDEPSHEECYRSEEKGCYCKKPYVKFGGDCILPEDCPRFGVCPKNERFLETGCNSICGAPIVTSCVEETTDLQGCYCIAPYSLTDEGRCVKRSECPKN
ncbi:hypothetical protein QR680_015499 [Steinernema hermaphroditum]|uniref:TIL domain-containing protein n=1 Tax=Steinernema hermaphroditum TaxID=289476 RepID=A0AA39H7W5_9BILA|nr:hypothetical protein QR680_015499 [Steinernema hermaphroditum]